MNAVTFSTLVRDLGKLYDLVGEPTAMIFRTPTELGGLFQLFTAKDKNRYQVLEAVAGLARAFSAISYTIVELTKYIMSVLNVLATNSLLNKIMIGLSTGLSFVFLSLVALTDLYHFVKIKQKSTPEGYFIDRCKKAEGIIKKISKVEAKTNKNYSDEKKLFEYTQRLVELINQANIYRVNNPENLEIKNQEGLYNQLVKAVAEMPQVKKFLKSSGKIQLIKTDTPHNSNLRYQKLKSIQTEKIGMAKKHLLSSASFLIGFPMMTASMAIFSGVFAITVPPAALLLLSVTALSVLAVGTIATAQAIIGILRNVAYKFQVKDTINQRLEASLLTPKGKEEFKKIQNKLKSKDVKSGSILKEARRIMKMRLVDELMHELIQREQNSMSPSLSPENGTLQKATSQNRDVFSRDQATKFLGQYAREGKAELKEGSALKYISHRLSGALFDHRGNVSQSESQKSSSTSLSSISTPIVSF